jgi:hypothetical protein
MSKWSFVCAILAMPLAASADVVYHGDTSTFTDGDVLTIHKNTAIIKNVCIGPGGVRGGATIHMKVVKNTPTEYEFRTHTQVMSITPSNKTVWSVDHIIMHFKKEPNGDLKLFGTPPKVADMNNFHGSTCEFGISKAEYEGSKHPYKVVFIHGK